MARLSQDERDIIEKYPLGNALDHLQRPLREAEQSYDAAVNDSGQGAQKAISRLLSVLLGHEVAFDLCSKISNENIASELSTLFRRVQNRNFIYEHYRALVRLVVRNAPEVDIWDAVFDLIVTVSRSTSPTSVPLTFDGTPITRSSASQQGDEQTKELLNGPLFHEFKRCTYRGVGGFFSKYFEGKVWTERGKEIYNAVKHRHVDGWWTDFPNPSVQNAVWEWLVRFQDEFLSDTQGVYFTTRSTKDLTGAEALRQLDLFIKPRSDTVETTHMWKDVRVIGEHKQSKDDFKTLLLQLGRYMRDVFTAQPTRRFIHGFFLHGTTMELWVFDRSGPYSSGEFDIHEEPEQFIRAVAGYAMMNDEELGMDTFVERNGGDLFITIMEDATAKEKRFRLEHAPLVVQRAIVCRGTTCYLTKDLEDVAKFSWTSAKRPPEANILRLAHQKGVKGVARLLGYHRITSIQEMRSGLTFPAPHRFRSTSPNTPASFSCFQLQPPLSQSFGPFRRLSIVQNSSRTSSKKRKSADNEAKPLKRSRSNSQRSRLPEGHNATESLRTAQPMDGKSVDHEGRLFMEPASISHKSKSCKEQEALQAPENAGTRKPKSEESKEKSLKRLGSNSQRSHSSSQECELSHAFDNAQASSFCDSSDTSFDNRVFGCLIISPAGRALKNFCSISELLMALRDAIKAHRSLYLEGTILHRDISENNIIITNPKQANGFTGMLIDADLAKIVDGGRTGARQQTGTMEFMAIEVLRKIDHTYRHDLESFFYVLLWICARRAWEREFECKLVDRPRKSILTMWYTGDFDDIARRKRGDMGVDGFEDILEEFPSILDCLKDLCRTIRGILFPFTHGLLLFTGTKPDPEKLYGPILEAYDETIAEIARAEGDSR